MYHSLGAWDVRTLSESEVFIIIKVRGTVREVGLGSQRFYGKGRERLEGSFRRCGEKKNKEESASKDNESEGSGVWEVDSRNWVSGLLGDESVGART